MTVIGGTPRVHGDAVLVRAREHTKEVLGIHSFRARAGGRRLLRLRRSAFRKYNHSAGGQAQSQNHGGQAIYREDGGGMLRS